MALTLDVVLTATPGRTPGDLATALHGVTQLPITLRGIPARGFAWWRPARPTGPVTARVTLSRWATLADAKQRFDCAAGAIAERVAAAGFDVAETAVWSEDGERVPVALPSVKASNAPGRTLPPLDPIAFAHIIGRDAQVRLVYDALKTAFSTGFRERPHVLLHGPAGCGKSELCKAFAAFLGVDHVWCLDGTTLSKAGLETELLRRAKDGTLPPVVVLEEIEKAPAGVLRCLLQVMDSRASVSRLNARTGEVSAPCRSIVIATANDLAKLGKLCCGALASRFAFKLLCPRPDALALRGIVARHAARPEYVDAVCGFLDTLARDPLPGIDPTDPRFALALLAGGDRLLDGSFFEDMRAAQ